MPLGEATSESVKFKRCSLTYMVEGRVAMICQYARKKRIYVQIVSTIASGGIESHCFFLENFPSPFKINFT